MVAARISPSTRTLGSQLWAISTVEPLMSLICFMASPPIADIAISRKHTTIVILARIE